MAYTYYKDGSPRRNGGQAYNQHRSLKEYIRERDNYTCQLCGAEGWIVDQYHTLASEPRQHYQ